MSTKHFPFSRADIYDHLDDKYDIAFSHSISRLYFYHNAERFEQWIHIYFANPALFINRNNGATLLLRTFLEQGPETITQTLLENQWQPHPLTLDFYPLMNKQLPVTRAIAMKEIDDTCRRLMADYAQQLQDQEDEELSGATLTAVHDNRYIQPMKYRFPPRYREGKHASQS